MPKIILLLWVIHLTFIYIVDSDNVHYITPSPTTQCPGESCLTLSTLAANSRIYFDSNTTVVFLKGNHTLDSELVLSNINGSLMLSTNGSDIVCSGNAKLKFFHITQLQISGLVFIRCSSKVELVDQFTLENSRFYAGNIDTALYLNHTNTNITGSYFVSNTAGTYQSHVLGLALLQYSVVYVSEFWLHYKIQSTSTRVGGALVVTSSNVTISSSCFDSNTAKVGGAIFLQLESSINISDCIFTNNSATGCSDDGCLGGVLFIDSGCAVTAHNCIFINNTAEYGGGAIALFQGTFSDIGYNVINVNGGCMFGSAIFAYGPSTMTMDNSCYGNNKARYGGAIFAQSYSNITMDNNSFTKNEAGEQGGVVFVWHSSSLTVTNSSFENNKANHSGGVILAYLNSSITVRYSSFNNNIGHYGAGVLYARSNSHIIVGNSSFDKNTAGNVGGVAAAQNMSSISVVDSFFESNIADIGGVLFGEKNSRITVSNSSFSNNKAARHGGVMNVYSNSIIVICFSFFDNNTAGNDGGVMNAINSSNITVHSSTFISSVAGDDGGVLSAGYSSSITVCNSSFDNNTAGNIGGVAIAWKTSSISISDSFYENNEAGGGGVLFGGRSSSITVSNSSFINNKAGDGGVVSAYRSSSISVSDSLYENNKADRSGGVLFGKKNSSITVSNSSFCNNKAARHGGVVNVHSNSSIVICFSFFDNNTAGQCGGVMTAFISSNITVGNSSFINSVADARGGVMSANSSSSITVDSSSFSNNTAGWHGGVMIAFRTSNITVDNSLFINSVTHHNGGVIYAQDSSSITINSCSFDNNTAGNVGGVANAFHSSSISVADSLFENNEADSGGVLFGEKDSSIAVSNGSFINNKAGDGGVVSAYSSSSISVSDSLYENNEADGSGGVLFGEKDSSITVSNSSFINNKAGDGGVVSAYSSSSISVSNSLYENNEADGSGGVLFGEKNSRITLSNSSFVNNKAARHGGVMNVYSNSIMFICFSFFDKNTAGKDGGVIYASSSSNVSVGNSSFYNNKAGENGGVMYVHSSSNIDMELLRRMIIQICRVAFYRANNNGGADCMLLNMYSEFNIMGNGNNQAGDDQGALYSSSASNIIVDNSSFHNNMASNGGVVTLNDGYVEITSSRFVNNSATNSGGALHTPSHHLVHIVRLQTSYFINNSATSGGAIAMLFSATVTVTHCNFTHNHAIRGGAMCLLNGNNLTTSYSNYTKNSAKDDGGIIYLEHLNRLNLENCQVTFNRADMNGGVICLLLNSELDIMGDCNTFIGNQASSGGVAYVRESTINIHSQALLMANNTAHSGGAMHVSSSRIDIYNGSLLFAGNTAKDTGGAVYSSKSNLSFVSGDNTFEGNKAKIGGAIYLDEGQLVFVNGNSILVRNRANRDGGGVYAANSSIIIEGAVNFVSNEAETGGGVSLEKNAKLCKTSAGDGLINFVANNASRYGGALFVNDYTNPDLCAAVSMLNTTPSIECFSKSVFINVSNNSAGESGSTLFGGLLDRCRVDSGLFVKNETYELGIMNFLNSSNINRSRLPDGISSHPVRLCFCRDGEPDCKYQPEPIQVNRGEIFSIELIAYDQVHHAVSASIRCDHNLSAGGLGEGQRIQIINKKCTKLKYNVFTTNEYVRLTFSAERNPCKAISEISKRSIVINITCFCPIGFQIIIYNNKASCDCVCDPIILKLSKMIECSQTTKSIIRRENCWISYVNHTWSNSSGYIIYPHCPFDYCYFPDKQVSINLNLPNGSDAQCDSNRMGTLCGTCKSGLSVSLGNSKCMLCPIYWPGLLVTVTIVFIISGIGLVALLLALNLTVAIGTLNAIIFYANIVVANKSAFFPSGVSPASVFISWLNFDIGFDTCFFNGLDTYVKTWLQLAFPTYIIILVVVIIKLSYHFTSFGRLVGKKDPVATLATLILLSYTKLLQTIITAFSSATLVYPDGSKKTLWLPDATVEYFTNKHAVLFFVAILILLAGLIYTLLLLLWQWLLRCPRKQVKWIRNPKLSSFIGMYLVPYTPEHRYWTGLLLLVRVSVYLVSAFNPTGDPKVTLSATNFIISSLVIYIATFGVRMYNNYVINTIETLTYFNIITLSIFTWYTLDADTNQMAITNISVCIVFIQLIVVIVYHLYKHMIQKLFATIKGSVICMKIKTLISKELKRCNYGDTNVLLDGVDHPFNTNDYYNFSQNQPRSPKPTQSVVELPNSQLTLSIPPPLKAKEEESELESTVQQASEQDDIGVIQVKENLSAEIYKSKQCIDDYSGIEIAERNETEIEHSTNIKENSIPEPNFNVQINYHPTTESGVFKEANKEAVEIYRSDNMDQGKQEVSLFPANSVEQVHGSQFSIHHR